MRLACVETGHDTDGLAFLAMVREARGEEPVDVLKTLWYRPDFFGRPFSAALETALRGPSEWLPAERELFAAFVAGRSQCPF